MNSAQRATAACILAALVPACLPSLAQQSDKAGRVNNLANVEWAIFLFMIAIQLLLPGIVAFIVGHPKRWLLLLCSPLVSLLPFGAPAAMYWVTRPEPAPVPFSER